MRVTREVINVLVAMDGSYHYALDCGHRVPADRTAQELDERGMPLVAACTFCAEDLPPPRLRKRRLS